MTKRKHHIRPGDIFGRLTVVKFFGRNKQGHEMWVCTCNCGKIKTASIYSLKYGYTKSCGCLNDELRKQRSFRHGECKVGAMSKEYIVWSGMKGRCFYKKHKDFKHYGGRGITVCERWRDSYPNFLSDMGRCPESMQLDRIDNSKGYYPDNCHWTTQKQNANNRRSSRMLTFKGKTMNVTMWAKELRVPAPTLFSRVYAGKPVERILST